MRWIATAALALGMTASYCAGDVVYLRDGRKFEGTVTTTADTVSVQTKFGEATFSKGDVDRIEKKALTTDIYAQKLAGLSADDVKGHYELGVWCKQNGLPKEARDEFEKVIARSPDHAEARAELGFVKVDGKWQQAPPGKVYGGESGWLTPAEAMQNAQAQYKLGKYEMAQKMVERVLESGLATEQRVDAQMLLGELCERQGKWDDAIAQYDKILKVKLTPAQKAQTEARVEIIKESKGGMYLVKESTGKEDIFSIDMKSKADVPKNVLKGLQPLSNPDVMDLAMREKATVYVLKGKDLLDEAKKTLDGTDTGNKKGLVLLDQADAELGAGDMIVKDIARGFLLDSVRQRYGILQKQFDQQNAAYQGLASGLNGATKEKAKALLPVMGTRVTEMEKTLAEMDQVARRFPDEMADQVSSVREMRNKCATVKAYIVNSQKGL